MQSFDPRDYGIVGFDPFEDWDPDDDEVAGTARYEDGSTRTGMLPRSSIELLRTEPPAPAPAAPPQPPAPPARPSVSEQQAALEHYLGTGEVPEPQAAVPRPAAPTPAEATPEPPSIQIPKSSRIAYVHNNPGNLKFVGQDGAVRGEPAEDGGHWAAFETPEDGYAALHRQIQLDADRGKTVGDFITKYAPPSSNDTAGYIAAASRALGASPDAPLASVNRERVARFMAQHESSTTIGGAFDMEADAAQGSPAGAFPATAGGMPPSVGGMPMAQASLAGVPLSDEQLADRQRQVMDQTHMQMAAAQQVAAARMQGRNEALEAVRVNYEDQKTNAERQMAEQQQIKLQAQNNIEQAMSSQLDPGRLFRGMSAGGVLLGLFGVMLSAAGQTLQQRGGNPSAPNMALQRMTKIIDDDIEMQKQDKQSRLAYWQRVFGNAEQAISAARAEAYNASAKYLEAKAQTGIQNADIQAQAIQQAQALLARGQAEAQKLQAVEEQKLSIRYAPPKPVAMPPVGALESGALAKVGVEDRDPEVRAELANLFDPKHPTHRGQMTTLTKEMQHISKLEQTLRRFETAYGVRPDEGGKYPTDDNSKYATKATGPWWNPGDWLPDDERDRAIGDLWSQVELDTRMGWVTEPNGETTQIRLAGIAKPKRDDEAPNKLKELREEIERRKQDIMSGTLAPVRAAWKFQNEYPLSGAQRSGKRQAQPGELIQ